MASKKSSLYPQISIKLIKKPSRFYAIPLVGFVIKGIMLLPVVVYLGILSFANMFILIINAFYILFTSKYWDIAYDLNMGIIRLSTKMTFFLYGMTDEYPGFSFAIDDDFSIAIAYPKKPSKLFAIPILGFFLRVILLIPYIIYEVIISRAAMIALVVGSFFVVFTGKYPESDYELNRDSVRINRAASMWFAGLSDEYPSFWISMNHMGIKMVLIVIASLMTVASYSFNFMGMGASHNSYKQPYYNTRNNTANTHTSPYIYNQK